MPPGISRGRLGRRQDRENCFLTEFPAILKYQIINVLYGIAVDRMYIGQQAGHIGSDARPCVGVVLTTPVISVVSAFAALVVAVWRPLRASNYDGREK